MEEIVYVGALSSTHHSTKHTRHPLSQCTYPHSDAVLAVATVTVRNLTINETEALQHLYTVSFHVRFRMLGHHQVGECTQGQCSPPMVLRVLLGMTPMPKYNEEPFNLLSLESFGHSARMDDSIDLKQILTSSPSVDWKRTLERPRIIWMARSSADADKSARRA